MHIYCIYLYIYICTSKFFKVEVMNLGGGSGTEEELGECEWGVMQMQYSCMKFSRKAKEVILLCSVA